MPTRVIIQADPSHPYNSVSVCVMDQGGQSIVFTEMLEGGAVGEIMLHGSQSISITDVKTYIKRRVDTPEKPN